MASHAIKILMNSFYGVLGTPACRFYNPALANAITGMGKQILLWSKDWFEDAGFHGALRRHRQPVRADAASTIADEAEREGRALAVRLNREFARYIVERWRVTSHLELEFEKLYAKLFLAAVRHGIRRRAQALCRRHPRRRSGKRRVRRHGSRAPRLDRARQAGAARTVSAAVQRTTRRSIPHRRRRSGAPRRAGSCARLSQRPSQRTSANTPRRTPPHVAAARKSTQQAGPPDRDT